MLDARVVVEILEMAERTKRAACMGVQVWSAVSRQRKLKGLTERGHGEDAGDSPASRDVGLHDVDAICVEHAPEVVEHVAIFAGADLHSGGSPIAQKSKS